tara:strand:- start:137 stop:463 length:327 start_codon:yes stop_codon:yes gene_type:complete
MIYYIDIDGTICEDIPMKGKTEATYRAQMPFEERIEEINRLYDQGHEIHYWTARGATSGKNWTELTTEQLKKWGCKYTALHMGKPHFDIYICDKSYNSNQYFTQNSYE